MKSVGALIRTARKDNEALARRWRHEQTKRSDVERQASAEEAKKLKAARDAKLQIEAIEPRLAERAIQLQAQKDQIRPWDEQVAVLDVEAAKFEAEASFADRGLDRTGVRGCGNEVCKPAQKNAAGRRKKIANIQKELKPKHDELAGVTAEIEVFQKTFSGLREQAAYLSGRGERKNAMSAPLAFDLGSGLQGLDEARREFERDPSWSAINPVKASCDVLLPALREMKLASDLPESFQCAPQSSDLQGLLDRRASYAGARKTFDARCGLEGKLREQLDNIAERVRKRELQPPLALTEAKKIVDGCVALAGTTGVPGAQLLEFYNQANDFVLARSLERNRFDLATEELFKTPAANKALAVAQDMLILIYKFLADFYKYRWRPRGKIAIGAPIDLSDNMADPNKIRARKALPRLAKPGRHEVSGINDADVDAPPAQVATNLEGLLNGLARRQAVWRVRTGVQGIENSVLFAVESELQEPFGSPRPMLATALPPPPARTIAGRARDGRAEQLSHSDSQRLLPIDALDFSQTARGNFANSAVAVLSALLAIGRRALAWISPQPSSGLNP
ncbi:MAG: hypothetical protein WBE80_09595 [Methylocella sp.]